MTLPDDSEIEKVLSGESSVLFLGGDDPRKSSVCVISGAFNPVHSGHLEMARFGQERLSRPAVFELCVANADKPALTLEETRARIEQDFGSNQIALTRAPTFLEKAAIFPGATFLVGVDTIYRVAVPRFYEDDFAIRDMAIDELTGFGCRFLVFGRSIENRFVRLRDLDLPPALVSICDEVDESEFRSDESSSNIRGDEG